MIRLAKRAIGIAKISIITAVFSGITETVQNLDAKVAVDSLLNIAESIISYVTTLIA